MKRSVLVADNHPIFRQGVKKILEDSGLFKVIAEAADGPSCITKIRMNHPDILVLDLNMPGLNGFDVVKELWRQEIKIRIVVISMHASEEFVSFSQSLGCSGFIAKEDASGELVEILSDESEQFIASSSAGSAEPELKLSVTTEHEIPKWIKSLTTAEIKVLGGVAKAKTSPQIASENGISSRTVHAHRDNICKKLDLQGTNALLEFAVQHKEKILEQFDKG